jgi:DNA-binding CsgD family transcriptional regulator
VVIMPSDSVQLLPLQLSAYGLSEREKGVVVLVLDGLDTRAIAARLSISALTVQDHLKSIFKKTEVTSRRELTYRLGASPQERPAVPAEMPRSEAKWMKLDQFDLDEPSSAQRQ